MSTRARATSMRAIRHGARRLTARARAAQALLASGRRGLLPSLPTDQLWYRDRNFTQPWVYPQDLEQQVQGVYDPSGFPRPWALGPDLLGGAGSFASTAAWSLTGGGASQAVAGGVLTITRGTTTTYTTATMTTVIGRRYYVTLRVEGFTQNPVVRLSTTLGGSENASVTYTNTGTRGFDFVATATTTYLSLYAPGANGDTTRWSGITVQEVILDQSWLSQFSTNDNFASGATGWSAQGGWSIGTGSASVNSSFGTTLLRTSETSVSGRAYVVSFVVSSYTSGIFRAVAGTAFAGAVSATGTYTFIVVSNGGGGAGIWADSTNTVGTITSLSVREIPGNPIVSPSAGNGPVATARVNLLQRTEDLSSAAWVKTSVTVSGTDTVTANSSTGGRVSQSFAGQPVAAGWKIYLEMKQGTAARNRVLLRDLTNNVNFIQATDITWTGGVPVVNGITAGSWATPVDVGGGWYRFQATGTGPSGSAPTIDLQLFPDPLNGTGSVQIRRTDLRLSVYDSLNLPAYQRVNDGTAGVFDYDHVGFPVWLTRGAANRGLVTLGTLDLTATDAVSAGMVALKTSDAALSALLELSPTVFSNNGAFWIGAPDTNGAANVQFRAGGTVKDAIVRSSLAAPVIVSMLGESKIATDTLKFTVNGVQTTSAGDQGSGNYGNHRVNIGGRDLAGTPLISFSGFYALPLIADANAIGADLAAEVLREMAASVGHTY